MTGKTGGLPESRRDANYCQGSSRTCVESVKENGIQSLPSSSSVLQIRECDEARRRFPNARSISSAQFYGHQEKWNNEAKLCLQKFSTANAISGDDLFQHRVSIPPRDVPSETLPTRLVNQAVEDVKIIQESVGEFKQEAISYVSGIVTDIWNKLSR